MGISTELTFLFFSALLAATILPAQSEVILGAMHLGSAYGAYLLLLVAGAGNVLGSVINWILGRYCVRFKDKRWFPIKDSTFSKAVTFYNKRGFWVLLLAWVPIIGDPLTLVAGFLRTNFWIFLLLVTIGKFARYASILYLI